MPLFKAAQYADCETLGPSERQQEALEELRVQPGQRGRQAEVLSGRGAPRKQRAIH